MAFAQEYVHKHLRKLVQRKCQVRNNGDKFTLCVIRCGLCQVVRQCFAGGGGLEYQNQDLDQNNNSVSPISNEHLFIILLVRNMKSFHLPSWVWILGAQRL